MSAPKLWGIYGQPFVDLSPYLDVRALVHLAHAFEHETLLRVDAEAGAADERPGGGPLGDAPLQDDPGRERVRIVGRVAVLKTVGQQEIYRRIFPKKRGLGTFCGGGGLRAATSGKGCDEQYENGCNALHKRRF